MGMMHHHHALIRGNPEDVLQVAAFLQDDEMVADNAERIAHAFRAALRADLAASGAMSAPTRPPGIELPPFLAAADAAQAALVFPRIPPELTLSPGPHLRIYLASTPLSTLSGPVLEAIAAHLRIYETLPAPAPLRTAALAVSLATGTLDLAPLSQLNPVSAPDPVSLPAIFRTLQPSLQACPPITALRIPASALFDRAAQATLTPHLPHLQHLTICGGFATVEHPAVLSFVARLPSRHLQTLDLCDCRNLPLSAHVWHNTCLYGLDMPPPLRWFRQTLNRIRPPRRPKLHPKLTNLRSLNLHIHSQDPAMPASLPMQQLTRLRIAVSDCPHFLRPGHPAAIMPSSGAPSVNTVAVEASTLTALASALHSAAVLCTLHLDISLATLSSAAAGRELHTLADAISVCTTLSGLGFLLRDSHHTQRPPLFTSLSQLSALERLTCSQAGLIEPSCLRSLPALKIVEFLRTDGAAHPESSARALVAEEGLTRVDRLVLPGPLSTQEFYGAAPVADGEDEDEEGGGDAAAQRPLAAIRVVGALEGYRRLSGTCLASHQYTCHCWDPSGYDAFAANAPQDGGASAAESACADPGMHVVSAALLPRTDGGADDEEPQRIAGMESVRVLKLYVREGGSLDRALNCLRGLDRLQRVEVTGIERWPWVGGFLGALRAVAPLTHVTLHGYEGYATRLLEELEQLPRLKSLQELDMMVTVVDTGYLGVPREAEVSGRTHSARRGNSAKLKRLREKFVAVEERWRDLQGHVEKRLGSALEGLPALETVRVHLECPAMESVAHKLLR